MPKIKFRIKKFFKWIIAFLILVLTCSAITVPIECTNNSVQTQSITTSVPSLSKNQSNNFNLDEAIKKVPESTVLAKLKDNFQRNTGNSLVALNPQNAKELKEQKIVQKNAIQNVKEIYAGKINLQKKLDQLKVKLNKESSKKQLDYLNQLINDKKKQVEATQKLEYRELEMHQLEATNLFYYNIVTQNTLNNAHQKLESLENELKNGTNGMLTFACVSTTAAIASGAIAIAIWAIPFFGWFEEAFAIADTVIDSAAAGMAWGTYYAFKSANSTVENNMFNAGTGMDGLSALCLVVDLRNIVSAINKLPATVEAETALTATDEATNMAGSTAEPEVAAWYDVAIDVAAMVVDSVSMIVGTISQFLPPTISQIQQEISQSQNN